MDLFIHWFDFTLAFYQSEKFFLVKEQFVNQSAEAYSKRIRSQHAHTIAKHSHAVNIFFLIIFRMGASKCHANFIFGYVQKKMNEMNEMNKVNDISKINENSVSLFHAKFENTFHAIESRWQFQRLVSPFLTIASNSDCTPISPHVIIHPLSNKRILCQRRAIVIASRLHYSLFPIATDNFI
jgi:hypothetical protein